MFAAKQVASVAGGLEVMLAAGFELTSDAAADEAVLVFPMDPAPAPPLLRTALARLVSLEAALQAEAEAT